MRSIFGTVIFRIPLVNSAAILASLTCIGKRKVRSNAPWLRSQRWKVASLSG